MIQFNDLINKFHEVIAPENLSQQGLEALALVFSIAKYQGMVKYKDI